MSVLGTKRKQKPPSQTGGEPGLAWFRVFDRYAAETDSYLEDGSLLARIVALEVALEARATAVEARVTTLEGIMSSLDQALVTGSDGSVSLRTSDDRLTALLELVRKLLQQNESHNRMLSKLSNSLP